MSRRLRVQTKELGPLELFVIYEKQGVWEPYWNSIQYGEVAKLFTYVSKEVYDHALHGWTSPLIKELGLDPKLALRKLPLAATQCETRKRCPFYDRKRCIPTHSKMPWCYDANVGEDAQIRSLTSEIIRYWREGVYVVVMQESE